MTSEFYREGNFVQCFAGLNKLIICNGFTTRWRKSFRFITTQMKTAIDGLEALTHFESLFFSHPFSNSPIQPNPKQPGPT